MPTTKDLSGNVTARNADSPIAPRGRRVVLYDQFNNPIGSSTIGRNTSLNVNVEDVDTEIVNLEMHTSDGNYTLASDTTVGDTAITVTDATGLSVGDRLELSEEINFQYTLPTITVIVSNTLTLDGPIDVAYTTAATVRHIAANMAVVGTLASPISYEIGPHSSQVWHLTRLNFTMVHKTQGTDALFGSLVALKHGVIIRQHTALLGVRTIANWKSNQDMRADMYDVDYSDKAGPSLFGTAGRWSFKQRTGTVIRLDGATNDQVEVLIQDDLTASSNEISDFRINMQGHVEAIG